VKHINMRRAQRRIVTDDARTAGCTVGTGPSWHLPTAPVLWPVATSRPVELV
jgi:hypothetical protein